MSDKDPRVRSEQAPPMRVLIAEDMPITGAMARAMLEADGYLVDIVTDGAAAVDAAAAGSYDIIFMDVHMPLLGGVSATGLIRSLPGAAGKTPIVAITAKNSRTDRTNLLAAGMCDHLCKPLRKAEVLEAARTWSRPSRLSSSEEASSSYRDHDGRPPVLDRDRFGRDQGARITLDHDP